jgi:hypothetical protein
MTRPLIVPSRFCGPPGTGNGGYVCGRIAAHLDGPAEITLRRPPPLATPMTVERDGEGSVRVLHGGALVAEGARLPDGLAMEPPGPVSIPDARAAGTRCRLRVHPDEHPFPGCFVCGPDRAPGDGLHILVGPVAGRDLSADVWHPGRALADPDGHVRPEFVWAALDCAGGVGALRDAAGGPPFVLGRLSARLIAPAEAGEPHVVTGWRLDSGGHKMTAGSALFTAAGQAVAVACATWIRLSGGKHHPPGLPAAGRARLQGRCTPARSARGFPEDRRPYRRSARDRGRARRPRRPGVLADVSCDHGLCGLPGVGSPRPGWLVLVREGLSLVRD